MFFYSITIEIYWFELKLIRKDENLNYNNLVATVSNYLFTQKEPMRDEVIGLLYEKLKLKERASLSKRITSKIVRFVEVFIEGMG